MKDILIDNLEQDEELMSDKIHIWEKFEQVSSFEHDQLKFKQKVEALEIGANKHADYHIPVFITGLKASYDREEIENFMFEILEIDCVFDSIRRRTSLENNQFVYDVLVWASENNYVRIQALEDAFAEIYFKGLCDYEVSLGLRDFMTFLPADFLVKVKVLMKYTLGQESTLNSVEELMSLYCDDPEGLMEELYLQDDTG